MGMEGYKTMNYSYPIEETWSKEEIADVVRFYERVESAYEVGVKAKSVLDAYERFKQIVPSKSEEKTYFRSFEKNSGYASFKVVQKARKVDENTQIKC